MVLSPGYGNDLDLARDPSTPAEVLAKLAHSHDRRVKNAVAVNPNIIAMQMESGIGYGLSAALTGTITLKDGLVEQSNFHDYPVLRMNEMPPIEVVIVPSQEKPTGVGEPGTPVIAPALANAILAMNGKPVRSLPLSAQGLQFA